MNDGRKMTRRSRSTSPDDEEDRNDDDDDDNNDDLSGTTEGVVGTVDLSLRHRRRGRGRTTTTTMMIPHRPHDPATAAGGFGWRRRPPPSPRWPRRRPTALPKLPLLLLPLAVVFVAVAAVEGSSHTTAAGDDPTDGSCGAAAAKRGGEALVGTADDGRVGEGEGGEVPVRTKCGLYLAPSSRREGRPDDDPAGTAAGTGISWYAGVEVKAGGTIGRPEFGILLVDVVRPGQMWGGDDDDDERPPILPDDVVSFLWTPSDVLGQWEDRDDEGRDSEEDTRNAAIITGVGISDAFNTPGGWYNARWDRASLLDRYRFHRHSDTASATSGEAGTGGSGAALDVRRDPGAGAVSEFHTIVLRADTGDADGGGGDLGAGTEIFPHFGQEVIDYFERESAKAEDESARSHYLKADSIMRNFTYLIRWKEHRDYFTMGKRDLLWNLLRNTAVTDRRIRNILPTNHTDIDSIIIRPKGGGASVYHHNPGTVRSMDWLEDNGRCVDHLEGRPSMIDGAGMGAFATRGLPRGTIVAPGPLICFTPDQLVVPTTTATTSTGPRSGNDGGASDDGEDDGGPPRYQLLMNYCLALRLPAGSSSKSSSATSPENDAFGFNGRTLLLFPYGAGGANLINHSSDRPNVAPRWSTSTGGTGNSSSSVIGTNSTLLEIPLEDGVLRNPSSRPGLSVDFVATMDIEEGEEVLMDYGPDWEDAWNDHVRDWRRKRRRGGARWHVDDDDDPIDPPVATDATASVLNEANLPFPTLVERRLDRRRRRPKDSSSSDDEEGGDGEKEGEVDKDGSSELEPESVYVVCSYSEEAVRQSEPPSLSEEGVAGGNAAPPYRPYRMNLSVVDDRGTMMSPPSPSSSTVPGEGGHGGRGAGGGGAGGGRGPVLLRRWKGGDVSTRTERRCEVLHRQEMVNDEDEGEGEGEGGDLDDGRGLLYLVRVAEREDVGGSSSVGTASSSSSRSRSRSLLSSPPPDVGEDDEERRRPLYLVDVPHDAIAYVDAPGRGASHRPGAFRFPIGLPPDMIPDIWR